MTARTQREHAQHRPRSRAVTRGHLERELTEIRARLVAAEETVAAIANDEVDALVVVTRARGSEEVLTLAGAHVASEHFMEAMRDGAVTVGEDGTILHANRSFREVAGVPDLLDRSFYDFVEDVEGVRALIREAGESSRSLHTVVVRADGVNVPVDLRATLLPLQGVKRVGLLISSASSAVALPPPASVPIPLRTSAGPVRVEAVLGQVPTGLLLVDARTGIIGYANRRAEELLGRALAEEDQPISYADLTSWRPDGSIVEPEDLPASRVLRGNNASHGEELVYARPDATIVHTRTSAAPVHDDRGRLASVVVTFEDIGDEVLAREDAVANQRFRELFIAVLGHDLRDPLAAILAGAHLLLKKGGLGESQVRVVARMRNSANRMGRLTNEVVDFTRSRLGGGIVLRRSRTPLEGIVRAVAADLRTAHPDQNLVLDFEGDVTGHWDGDRLSQVIWNVLGNAFEHGDQKSPVRVTSRGEGRGVRLEVHNQGPPIEPTLLPVIFDPFRRADRAKSGQGLGLGLYIAQQIVEAHGGALSVESSAESGTTFTMLLPLE